MISNLLYKIGASTYDQRPNGPHWFMWYRNLNACQLWNSDAMSLKHMHFSTAPGAWWWITCRITNLSVHWTGRWDHPHQGPGAVGTVWRCCRCGRRVWPKEAQIWPSSEVSYSAEMNLIDFYRHLEWNELGSVWTFVAVRVWFCFNLSDDTLSYTTPTEWVCEILKRHFKFDFKLVY